MDKRMGSVDASVHAHWLERLHRLQEKKNQQHCFVVSIDRNGPMQPMICQDRLGTNMRNKLYGKIEERTRFFAPC